MLLRRSASSHGWVQGILVGYSWLCVFRKARSNPGHGMNTVRSACQDGGRGPRHLVTYDYLMSLPHLHSVGLVICRDTFEKNVRGFGFLTAPPFFAVHSARAHHSPLCDHRF